MNDSGINGSMDSDDIQPPTDQITPKPGARLALLRESKGLSVEDVAAQLNLAVRQVQAIESDNYEALPGMAITRGFMRAYAKLMKVDPDPLLALLPEQATVGSASAALRRNSLDTPILREHPATAKERRSFFTSWKAAVLLVAIILVVAAVLEKKGELPGLSGPASVPAGTVPAPTSPSSEASVNEQPVKQHEENPVAQTAPATSPATVTPGAPAATSSSASTPPTPSASAPTPAQVPAGPSAGPTPTVNAPATSEGEAVLPKNALVMKFREDSWVEVKRADDKVLIARLGKAGSTETVKISQPVSVLIGNAAGVDVIWHGKPVELKPGTKSNVARLNLK